MRDLRPLFWISLAVFVWGLVLAAGVWLFAGDDRNQWLRPLIIILFVDGFLGLWLAALFVRGRQNKR
jgi:hypothetical protein